MLPFGSGLRIRPDLILGFRDVELTATNLVHSFVWEMPPWVQARDIDTDHLLRMHKKNPLFWYLRSMLFKLH